LVIGYTLQIPVCVMVIVYLFDLARKYGYIHVVAALLMLTFVMILLHAGYRIRKMLF
jgi:hypothetical protein